MTIDEVRKAYCDEVHRALFRAEGPLGGRGIHILVYPYMDGRRGYLWAEWKEMDLNDIDGSIVAGGRETSFRTAVAVAMDRLLNSIDPPREVSK